MEGDRAVMVRRGILRRSQETAECCLHQQLGRCTVLWAVGRQVGAREALVSLLENSHVAARGVRVTSSILGLYVNCLLFVIAVDR